MRKQITICPNRKSPKKEALKIKTKKKTGFFHHSLNDAKCHKTNFFYLSILFFSIFMLIIIIFSKKKKKKKKKEHGTERKERRLTNNS
jgi:hypothetical protein